MTRSDSPRSTSHSRIVPSSLPLSRWRLSGVKARSFTTALWPSSAARALPSWPSHSRIVWSKPQLASRCPSGLQTTHCTLSVCPTSVCRPRRLPVSPTSHSLTVPSQLALASRLPLGAKASPRTQLLCPTSDCTQVAGPVGCSSHSRIVPAKSPLASRRPSGAKARQRMPFVCQPDQSKARLSTSHSLTLLSRLPLASVRSSGLKARVHTKSVWACQTRCKVWPASRHTRTSPRLLAAADGARCDSIKGLGKDALTEQGSGQGRVLQLDPLQIDAAQRQLRQIETTQIPAPQPQQRHQVGRAIAMGRVSPCAQLVQLREQLLLESST